MALLIFAVTHTIGFDFIISYDESFHLITCQLHRITPYLTLVLFVFLLLVVVLIGDLITVHAVAPVRLLLRVSPLYNHNSKLFLT